MDESQQKVESAEEQEAERRRRARNLLLAGAAALLLPLLGAAYVYMGRGDSGSASSSVSSYFDKRQGETLRPAAGAAVMGTKGGLTAPPMETAYSQQAQGGSLGYITGGEDYKPQAKPAAAQAQVPETPAAETKPDQAQAQAQPETPVMNASKLSAPPPDPATVPKKTVYPKLQPSSFGGGGSFAGGAGLGAKGQQAPAGGMPGMPPGMDMSQMMKMAGGAGGGAMPGMPPGMDMSKMMQNMPKGAGGAPAMPPGMDMSKMMQGGAGGAPGMPPGMDMSQMMKNMPGMPPGTDMSKMMQGGAPAAAVGAGGAPNASKLGQAGGAGMPTGAPIGEGASPTSIQSSFQPK